MQEKYFFNSFGHPHYDRC